MILTKEHLEELCSIGLTAAHESGALIQSYFNKKLTIDYKKGGASKASQVVTEVDILSEEIIKKYIIPTCKEYDLGLLAEESGDDKSRLGKDYFWCIDPLDGTLPFTESTEGYSVALSLIKRNGSPYIGIVYDPFNDVCYHGIKGKGAFRNGAPWKIKKESPHFTAYFDRSFTTHRLFDEIVKRLKEHSLHLGYKDLKAVIHGGAVMNACWVLDNSPSCYFKFPKSTKGGGCLWDYGSTTCIHNELHTNPSDIFGKPLQLNREDSIYMNQSGVIFTSDQKFQTFIQELYRGL